MRYAVNDTQLNVVEQGKGPLTLVFLHYFGGSVQEWKSVMERLPGQYRCVAIDLRGHGDSASPDNGYSVRNMADDVAALLGQLSTHEFVLIGHSMGGKVALEHASRQPAGLQQLVLLASSPPVPEPIPDDDRHKMLETHGQRSAAVDTLNKITAKRLPESVREQIVADNLRTSINAWKSWLMEGSREDISAQMPSIQVPVSVLIGTADKAILPKDQLMLTKPYVNPVAWHTIEGVGHLLPWEAPDDVATFIQHQLGIKT